MEKASARRTNIARTTVILVCVLLLIAYAAGVAEAGKATRIIIVGWFLFQLWLVRAKYMVTAPIAYAVLVLLPVLMGGLGIWDFSARYGHATPSRSDISAWTQEFQRRTIAARFAL